jgi:hypothetical protein
VPPSQQKPQYIALDTNVLIKLADSSELILDCKGTIEERVPDACFAILPTVIQELEDLSSLSGPLPGMRKWEKTRDLANDALVSILHPWRFRPIPFVPVMNGIIAQTARKIRALGLIPDDQENDSFIVAEAAALPAMILISSDSHICGIDKAALNLELSSCHLSQILISSPSEIIQKFYRRK